ncbi:MAG: DUF4291 domain-containing protein [Pseudonocardiaceae bacterium]
MTLDSVPERQVRAAFTDTTIIVYQAYAQPIADAALRSGKFEPPFKRDRMTWIKPSFRWMMYRSGWATKADQERILAIEITRDGFEWALANSCLSHYEPSMYGQESNWRLRKQNNPVLVQWDPERSLSLGALDTRAIQVGLSGIAVERYVDEWIVAIKDVTRIVRKIASVVQDGALERARRQLPTEQPYPLPVEISEIIGATR